MDKKKSDDLYYEFQKNYDSKMCKDSEYQKSNKEYDRISKEIGKLLPENKQDLLEQFCETNAWQISSSRRVLFYFMLEYLHTFLIELKTK